MILTRLRDLQDVKSRPIRTARRNPTMIERGIATDDLLRNEAIAATRVVTATHASEVEVFEVATIAPTDVTSVNLLIVMRREAARMLGIVGTAADDIV